MSPLGWALIQSDRCPFKRKCEHLGDTRDAHAHGDTMQKGSKGTAICKARREASEETTLQHLDLGHVAS